MKIVFYNETLLSGGIEKCIETLIDNLYKFYDIEIVYIDDTKLDNTVMKILSKHAYVHKLDLKSCIYADICVWCRLYIDYDKLKNSIQANRNFLWVHSKPLDLPNNVLKNNEFMDIIDKIICVSKTVQNELNTSKNSIVIHNFLPKEIETLANATIEENILNNEKKLKLITVSRISAGKGFNRMLTLVKLLKENNIDFEYIVIGKGRNMEHEIKSSFEQYNEVKFIGYKDNPYPYIKKADYLVQLSDYETWGNVITEAKSVQTPVIITNFPSAYEQVTDDYNGIIIDLNAEDYTRYLDRIIKKSELYKKKLAGYKYKNELEKWLKLL